MNGKEINNCEMFFTFIALNSEQLKTSTEETSGERAKRSIGRPFAAALIGGLDNPTTLFSEKDIK